MDFHVRFFLKNREFRAERNGRKQERTIPQRPLLSCAISVAWNSEPFLIVVRERHGKRKKETRSGDHFVRSFSLGFSSRRRIGEERKETRAIPRDLCEIFLEKLYEIRPKVGGIIEKRKRRDARSRSVRTAGTGGRGREGKSAERRGVRRPRILTRLVEHRLLALVIRPCTRERSCEQ